METTDSDRPRLYDRYYHNGQYANWKMITKEPHISPKYHVLVSLGLMFGSLGIMLVLAPMGMCYLPPYSTWGSACQFGNGMKVSQGDNMEVSETNCNTLYDKADWQKMPKIVYPSAIKKRMYTVMVLDPDAPNHTNGTYYLHMIQANVRGEDLKEGNFGRAQTIAPYIGPAPPQGSGNHRYMFVVYKHCRTIDILPTMDTPTRYMFKLGDWIESLPIRFLGPEAGVQFRAHY